MSITSAELRENLENLYPPTATCWSQATDEVRDLCRYGRNVLALGEEHAVDFRRLRTPSTWNLVGIDGIINFYEMMSEEQRSSYVQDFGHYMGLSS